MTTKVIYRKFKEGDVIALFPELPGDTSPHTCLSYQHIGQHGAASADLSRSTTLAKPAEYAELDQELKSIGYDDLKVYSRFTRNDFNARQEAINLTNKQESCKHPPARLYSGCAFDPTIGEDSLWVACCECGKVLKG